MRRIVIGDIHGCLEELLALLDLAGIGEQDEVIAIGDVVDRGPSSWEVLEYFRRRPRARCLMGNHELKHVRSLGGSVRAAFSQQIVRRQIGEGRYEEACAWMGGLPRAIELEEALLVHGFFEPGVALADQRDSVLIGTMTGQRHVERACGGAPWYTLYRGDKPLIVGHHDYLGTGEPLIHEGRVFGLDTGCCHGGRLTGLVLPGFEIVQVPSLGDHWRAQVAVNKDLRYTRAPIESLSWEAAEALVSSGAREREGLSAAGRGRLDAAAAALEAGERAVDRCLGRIEERTRAMVAAIREAEGEDLDARAEGRAFAGMLGKTPDGALFHEARRGSLTRVALRRRCGGPSGAAAMAARLEGIDEG